MTKAITKEGGNTTLPPPPPARHRALLPALALLVVASAVASLTLGPVSLPADRLLAALAGHGDPIAETILFELRLPRAAVGLLVGAMLGLAGAVLQGYLRNPLAEPSVLGASNGAALGAVAAIYFGLAQWHVAMLPFLSILAGLITFVLLFALAGRSESPLTLILAPIESLLAEGDLPLAGRRQLTARPFGECGGTESGEHSGGQRELFAGVVAAQRPP